MQIKSKERVRNFAEVFTAQREVNAMCNLIPDEMYSDLTRTFLEPACGEGVFILEILRRKFKYCKCRKDYKTALLSVYGMDIQADNVQITIDNIIGLCAEEYGLKLTKEEIKIINQHIILADSLKVMAMMNELNERVKNENR